VAKSHLFAVKDLSLPAILLPFHDIHIKITAHIIKSQIKINDHTMIRPAFIRSSYLDSFHSLVLARGASPQEFLSQVGLNDIPSNDGLQLISLERFVQLLENTAKTLNFPELGLHLAARQEVEILGPLTSALFNCPSLTAALEVMAAKFYLQVSGVEMHIEHSKEFSRLSFTTAIGDIRHSVQYQNYALASSYNTLDIITAQQCTLRGCFFPMPEPGVNHGRYHSAFFNCPIGFNSNSLSLTIDKEVMQRPLLGMESVIRAKAMQLRQLGKSDDFVDQVGKTMSGMALAGFHSLEETAAALGLSARTFQRRLKSNGTSFHHLRDAVRAKLAKQFIDTSHYRLTDIAQMLGYTQDSSFSRSYRRWYGSAPSANKR